MIVEIIAKAWLPLLLAALCALEFRVPRRASTEERGIRWPTNLLLGVLNGLLTSVPIAVVALAAIAAQRGWGLLNRVAVPDLFAVVVAVLALDALGYAQHRVLHASATLWRIHRVHHADVDLDATTALRFHPIEALISHGVTLVSVVVLGLPPAGVAAYVALSTVVAVLTHANARIPAWLERGARWLFVTPAMHAIHHSSLSAEWNRNFATVFPVWDRLGRTYREDDGGHEALPGLAEFRERRYLALPATLALPFHASPVSAPGERARSSV